MELLWNFCGTFMVNLWNFYGTFMDVDGEEENWQKYLKL